MKSFIVCSQCGTRISRLLDYAIALDFDGSVEKELLLEGRYGMDGEGDYYISTLDKYHLSYHHDQGRMVGCCGPSINGLPNLVCKCKAEVGREVTDCCTAHYIVLYKRGILMKEDSVGLLERVLGLEVDEEIKNQYEVLIQFGEVESVLKAIEK